MKISLVTSACGILLALATAVQVDAEVPAPDSRQFTLRFRQFSIPFDLPEKTTGPVSVQLHVSPDRGTTWQLVESVDRPSGTFQFRTEEDGTYWFCSLTVHADGRKLPATFSPEIRVRVDTTHPIIQLNPQVSPGGRIKIECRANDQVLTHDALKLEYIAGNEETWQPIPLEGAVQLVAPGSLLCRADLQPRTTARLVVIKATARDEAGNITVAHQRVFLPQVALRRSPGTSPPLPDEQGQAGLVPWPADNQPGNPPPPTLPNIARPASPLSSGRESPMETSDPTVVPLPRIDTTAGEENELEGARAKPTEARPRPLPDPQTDPLPDPLPDPEPTAEPRREAVIHATTSRRFHLEYELPDNPGNREVQLWGTVDGGKSWQKWGIDSDRTSPLHIATEADGLYGFRIVIQDADGDNKNAPTPGADADVWIRIDSREDGS